ncbi:hypothetical protein AAEH88_12385 [Shewanella algae]|uniref:Uncharacterized protein n=1 Tax=Shewanella algae TaxID=38313 RepID=A0A7T8IP20_9GAMM|nr:hypothetical protein D7032_05655 [Shewanella algae]
MSKIVCYQFLQTYRDRMLVAVAYIIVTLLMLIMLLKKGRSKLMLLYFILELYFGAVAVASYMD